VELNSGTLAARAELMRKLLTADTFWTITVMGCCGSVTLGLSRAIEESFQ
jgi:hypothetical protein